MICRAQLLVEAEYEPTNEWKNNATASPSRHDFIGEVQ
jgi:hypothetical protein